MQDHCQFAGDGYTGFLAAYPLSQARALRSERRPSADPSQENVLRGVLKLEEAVSALLAVRARIEQEIRTLEEYLLGFAKHSAPG